MADFVLKDDQNVDVDLVVLDTAGNAIPGAALDAGSVAASGSDGGTNLALTVSADQSSVNVKALGPEVTDAVVTVTGSLNGNALTAGTLAVDVTADPSAAATIGLVPGTPAQNA